MVDHEDISPISASGFNSLTLSAFHCYGRSITSTERYEEQIKCGFNCLSP